MIVNLTNGKYAVAFLPVPKPTEQHESIGIPAFDVNDGPPRMYVQETVATSDILQSSGAPLEALADWELVHNEQGGDSFYGYSQYGQNIVAFLTPSTMKAQNLAFKNLQGTAARLSLSYITIPDPNSGNWTLYGAKMIDIDNVVGARVIDNSIELVQRSSGSWTTIASVPFKDGRWDLFITDDHITLMIGDELIVEADHVVSGTGYFGISAHRINYDNVEITGNYNLEIL